MASDIKSDLKNGSVRHYSPSQGDEREQRLAPLHGNRTLPRISPDRPHCLRLWLDGSIIVGCSGLGGTIHHGSFYGRTFLALHLWCYRFYKQIICLQVVLACSPMPLSLITLEQLTYLNCWVFNFQGTTGNKKLPHFYKGKNEGAARNNFKFQSVSLAFLEFCIFDRE